MSKKVWLLLISAGIVAILSVVAVATLLYLLPQYRAGQNLERAEAAAESGKVYHAKRFYREYLYVNPGDVTVLEKYAALCASQLDDRRRNLIDAGRAYVKLMHLDEENTSREKTLLDFYRRYGYWDEFDAALDLIEVRNPNSPDLEYDRAVATAELRRTEKATELLEAYLEKPDVPRRDAVLRLARIYRAKERAAEALDVLKRELAAYPDDPLVKASYANYLLDDGDVEGAAVLLPDTVDIQEADMDLVLAVIRLHGLRGENEIVRNLSLAAVERRDAPLSLHTSHVNALGGLGEREAAAAYIESLDEVTRIDVPRILIYQIELLLAEGQTEEAEAVRETLATSYPGMVDNDEYLRGRIAFSKKDYEVAKERLTIATEMNQLLHGARLYLVHSLLALEDLAGARVSLERYLRDNPDDRMARQLWNQRFERSRSTLELRVAGERLLKEEGAILEELLFTAQALSVAEEDEDKELARELVEKAITVNPDAHEGYLALAGTYLQEGDIDRAESVINQAVDAGIDRIQFALLDAMIALYGDDEAGALAIAAGALEDSDVDKAKEWTSFFSRRGFLSAARGLLADRIKGASDSVTRGDFILFRAELAIQFDNAESALTQLRAAEEQIEKDADLDSALNHTRVRVAKKLLTIDDAERQKEAEEILADIAFSEPDHDGLRVLRARMTLDSVRMDPDQVLELLEGVSANSGYRNEADLLRAEVALQQGQFDRSEGLAQDVITRAPQNKLAWHVAGDSQLRQGDYEAGRLSFERVLELDRSDARAMRVLARIYADLRLGRKAEAMYSRYADLVAVRPDQDNGLAALRATLDLKAGKSDVAEIVFREKLSANPADFNAASGLVKSLAHQKRTDEALDVMRNFLKVNDPDQPEPWTFFGRVLLNQNDPAVLGEASSAFTRAQLLVPDYSPAQLGNIEVQTLLGNDGIAIAICERYLEGREASTNKLNAQDARILFRRATLRAKNKSGLEMALADLDRAISISEDPSYRRLRGALRHRLADFAGAIEDYRRVLEITGTLELLEEVAIAESYLGVGDLNNAQRYAASAKANPASSNAPESFSQRIDAVMAALAAEGVSQ